MLQLPPAERRTSGLDSQPSGFPGEQAYHSRNASMGAQELLGTCSVSADNATWQHREGTWTLSEAVAVMRTWNKELLHLHPAPS